MKYENVIEVDPEKLSGTPVFRGTRVPIQTFFDYLEDGESFEGEQNKLMLEQVKQSTEVLKPTVNFLKSIYAAGG